MRIQHAALRQVLLLVSLALLAPLSAAAQEAGRWTQRLTFGEGPALVENLWSQGRRMRAESVFGGNPIVTLIDDKRYVIVDVLRKTGISIARSPVAIGQDAKRKLPFGSDLDKLIASGAEKVGTEVRAGQDVDHYRVTRANGDRSELWVTQDAQHLPMEEQYRDRDTGAQNRRVYLSWVAAAFPDELFRPDPGVKLEEISYEEYLQRSKKGPVGPAPVLYADLLHGTRE